MRVTVFFCALALVLIAGMVAKAANHSGTTLFTATRPAVLQPVMTQRGMPTIRSALENRVNAAPTELNTNVAALGLDAAEELLSEGQVYNALNLQSLVASHSQEGVTAKESLMFSVASFGALSAMLLHAYRQRNQVLLLLFMCFILWGQQRTDSSR